MIIQHITRYVGDYLVFATLGSTFSTYVITGRKKVILRHTARVLSEMTFG